MNDLREGDESGFWSRFPDTETDFLAVVRDPGIHASVELEFSPETSIMSEYNGIAISKLGRLVEHWENQGQVPEHVNRDIVRKYEADVKAWNEEYEAAVNRACEKLPTPPFGCHWVRDSGGLIVTRKAGGKSVPRQLFFRLWRKDLGYMPRSE